MPRRVGKALQQHPVGGASIQGMRVIPSFGENRQQVSHDGSMQFEGRIVPRRPFAIAGIHVQGLRVSRMVGVVPTAVAEVDPADEGDVLRRVVAMSDDEEFLVVRAEQAYPLIQ